MKAAIEDNPIYWASLNMGKFEIYHNGVKTYVSKLLGRIVGYHIKADEYNGKNFNVMLFHTEYLNEKTIIAVRTDTGYFRTLVNYLWSAYHLGHKDEIFIFSPALKEDQGKKIFSIFLQNSKTQIWYKAFHTKETNSLPVPKNEIINGAIVWDWSEIVKFYENFIVHIYKPGWNNQEKPSIINEADDLPF